MKPNRMPHGPGKGGMKLENPGKIFKRLTAYVFKNYKVHCIAVLFLILISSLASVVGIMFMKDLIDDYIVPFIGNANPDFSNLLRVLIMMAGIFMVGVGATYLYNRIMIFVCQGTMKKDRKSVV